MGNEILDVLRESRRNLERIRLDSEGFTRTLKANTEVVTGKKTYADLKTVELEVKCGNDFFFGKSARDIVRGLRSIKKSADYNCDSDISEASGRVIYVYMPEATEEHVAEE